MSQPLLIASIAVLVGLPMLAERGGGGKGGGGMRRGSGFGAMHQGFRGGMHGGFRQPFRNSFRIRNFERSPFALGSQGYGGGNAGYGYPFENGYLDDDAQSYGALSAGNEPGVSPVIAVQIAPNIVSYVALDPRNASVTPVIPGYPPPPLPNNSGFAPTLYLIAFRDNTIHAALAYWAEGSTLNYVTVDHEQRQAPLASVDRALSERLNGERHVPFRLPPP